MGDHEVARSAFLEGAALIFRPCRHPPGGEGLHIAQALDQVCTRSGQEVAAAAVVQQAGFAQVFDAGVERIRGDAAHAVLQKTKSLRVAITQGPEHAQSVAGFEQVKQLADGGFFFGAHGCISSQVSGGMESSARTIARIPFRYTFGSSARGCAVSSSAVFDA